MEIQKEHRGWGKLTSLGQSSEVRSGSKFLGNAVGRRTGWSKAHAHQDQVADMTLTTAAF